MLYQIIPKKDFQFDLENLTLFFKNIGSTRQKFSFKDFFKGAFDYQYIIDCNTEGKINFYLKINDTLNQDSVINAVNVWLGSKAVIFKADVILKDYSVIDTLYDFDAYNGKNNQNKKLATFANDTVYMNILAMLQPRTRITIDFRVTNVSISERSSFKFGRGGTDVGIECLLQVRGDSKYSRTNVMNVANSICSLTANEKQLSVKFKNKFLPIKLSGNELANLFQLPTLFRKDEDTIKRINYLFPGQITLNDDEYKEGIYVGKNYHPIQKDRKVYLDLDQARKHWIISGSTGSGKSSEVEEWIDELLLNKLKDSNAPGFTFFDPLESSALGVIDKIMKLKDDGHDIEQLLKKVRYIDLSLDNYIFPISLLNSNVSDPTETLDFFKSLYGDQNTIQVDRMMSSALKALLEDSEDHSIFDIQEIFNSNDDTFRQGLIKRLSKNVYATDEVSFLKNTRFNQSVSDPILNRLDPFKNTRQKKLMFGLPNKYDCVKDICKWMDKGYIILFNLKGLSKFDIKVICGYLTTQYYLTSLARPDFSMIHLLLIDEAHDVQMPIFPKIGAKSRKGGLGLFLITQFIEQFDPDYLKQLMGNINTFISFKQKEVAATTLQRNIPSQDVSKNDLMNLPTFVGYLSTEEKGKEQSILIKVKPPYRYTNGKLVDHKDIAKVQENLIKNRKFAHELMARDFLSREEAERIVYKKHFNRIELEEYEKELLDEGDSLVRAEDSNKLKEEIIWDD